VNQHPQFTIEDGWMICGWMICEWMVCGWMVCGAVRPPDGSVLELDLVLNLVPKTRPG
jgi:hypothetical protein